MTSLMPFANDTFPIASYLTTQTLFTAGHSVLHENLGAAVTTTEQWVHPAINVRVLGCVADDTANDSAVLAFLIQYGVNRGAEVYLPASIDNSGNQKAYRCDDGNTATRIVISYAAAKGESRIVGDGDGSTLMKSHVTLDVADKCLLDFTDTNPLLSPNISGVSIQGPGTFVDPNDNTKTANTTGSGSTMSGSGFGPYVGCEILAGGGIDLSGEGTYIRKVSGTTVYLSKPLLGSGGSSSASLTLGSAHPKVGCGYRVASCSHTSGVYAGGWHSGYLSTSESSSAIATDHTIIDNWCSVQENRYGHRFVDTVTGGTLDYYWKDFRVSRNARGGIVCDVGGHIGSSYMENIHFNAQPYPLLKLGTEGATPSNAVFIDGLVMNRVKFEGTGSICVYDMSRKAVVRGLEGYCEPHGLELNGQKNKNSLSQPHDANDHTRRDIAITTLARASGGLVTATLAASIPASRVGAHIAVAASAANTTVGTGTITNGSSNVTSCVGFSAADVGRIFIGKGIPPDTIVGSYSAGTIGLKDFSGAAVNATSAGNGPGPWTGIALTASAWHGGYIIKTVTGGGTTVTWDTGISTSFGSETGATAGLIGFIVVGTFSYSDFRADYQNDPSDAHTFPERFISFAGGADVTIRPTQPEKIPVNWPQVQVTDSAWNPIAGNFVCKQGGITCWLARPSVALAYGTVVTVKTGGFVDVHDGASSTPVGGMCAQDTDGTIPQMVWVQRFDGGPIEAGTVGVSGHGPGLLCQGTPATNKELVVDPSHHGKVIAWDGTTTGLWAVASSTAVGSGGHIEVLSHAPFHTSV